MFSRDGAMREQAVALNDVADAPAQFAIAEARRVAPIDATPMPLVRLDQAVDHAQQGGFAGARRPDNHGEAAPVSTVSDTFVDDVVSS